jgi:para-aminobenzoate synthetase
MRTDVPVQDAPVDDLAPPRALPRDTETAYLGLVRACQEQIMRGESYEICLTTTWSGGARVGEAELYREMRTTSPVPHGVWLRSPAVSVLGCSPERFVRVYADGTVEARPIKGTRPRGRTPDEDTALVADLVAAQKDRAENLMIVDLLRHDLHRVCRAGSVHVPRIFEVETYATVHQLVSTVRGRLADGMGPTDVLRSCFPGGSMTGAPKVRTMEILDALEGAARGVYSGAVGWIGLDGSMDTSIVIRTATWHDGAVTFGSGGAVTALSDPAEEHAEMRTKATSVLRALSRAGRAGSAAAPGGDQAPPRA